MGRGLAAILTGPERDPAPKSLRARLADTALASLYDGGARDLCGYLYRSSTDELFLRAPDLGDLDPSRTYAVMSAVARAADGPTGRHRLSIADLDAYALVLDSGPVRSVFAFGQAAMAPDIASHLASFCEIYAPVLHHFDTAAADDENVHLVLDQQGPTSHAEVEAGGATGFGSSTVTHEAIASASIASIASEAKLVSVGEVRGSDGAAAFVVAAGDQGAVRMGAAPVAPAGVSVAVAVAALRAARQLVHPTT